jgi:hypothetical protein
MIRNQEIEMDNERIHQQVQESPNDWRRCESFICFFVDVDEPHSFVVALNGEDSQYWKKAMDFKF